MSWLYSMNNRPFSIGSQPRGGIRLDGDAKFGYVSYDRELTPAEVYDYELTPIIEGSERHSAAQLEAAFGRSDWWGIYQAIRELPDRLKLALHAGGKMAHAAEFYLQVEVTA